MGVFVTCDGRPTCPWVGRWSARPRSLSQGSGARPEPGAGVAPDGNLRGTANARWRSGAGEAFNFPDDRLEGGCFFQVGRDFLPDDAIEGFVIEEHTGEKNNGHGWGDGG